MKSAIELYQEAYNLHFRQGRPELARELYREIIDRFPDADERKYAQFLLARISSTVDTPQAQAASSSLPALATLSLLVSFIALAGIGGLFYFIKQQQNALDYFEKIQMGIHAMAQNSDEDALVILREAKILAPRRTAAYILASQIYARKNRFELAESEYKLLLSMVPDNTFAQEQATAMRRKQEEARTASQQAAIQGKLQPVLPPPAATPPSAPQRPQIEEDSEPTHKVLDTEVNYF